jgi:hypothetical protein
MKKKPCLSVYVALLFLIFLVVVFPYKEGFDTNTTITTGNTTTTSSYNFFDYYWPFSGKFLQSSVERKLPSVTQGETNIDSRTNNTAGYNDVDYVGFNTAGTGNDGTRYEQSL